MADNSTPSILYGRYGFVTALFLITITVFLIYSNTFSSSFHFDDRTSIIGNNKIRDLSNFLDLSDKRYVGNLSFALNYHFGELNVFGYHLVNIVIHIINGFLVYWLVILTFKTPQMGGSTNNSRLNSLIALASSLIFVSHPIQTQAVTYIVQRYASLATLFYLLSVVLFVKWRMSYGSVSRVVFYLFSILSAILAMKTKEISFTLPFVILLYDVIFFRDKWRRVYHLIPFLLTLPVIPLTIVSAHKSLGHMVSGLTRAAQQTESISRGAYLLTQFRVIVTYIRLLFFPVNQNLEYDYPIYHSFFTPGAFLSFLFLLLIVCLALYLFIRSSRSGNGYILLVCFGIFWFFITLSVESSIIPIKDVIFEHRLYLPSIGAVVAFSSAALYGFEYWKGRRGINISPLVTTSVFLLITVLPLSMATYHRNWVWQKDVTLWSDAVKKAPYSSVSRNNLGVAYEQAGLLDQAAEQYRYFWTIKPTDPLASYNLGVIMEKQGRLKEARAWYTAAFLRNPGFYSSLLKLGKQYAQEGHWDDAIQAYRRAMLLWPDGAEAQRLLADALFQAGRREEAEVQARLNKFHDDAGGKRQK